MHETPAPTRIPLGSPDELPEGCGAVVNLGPGCEPEEIAVFHVEGAFYAIDNACPHRGGPLGEGEVEGTTVVCPWHEFRFDVTSGRCVDTGYELPDADFSVRSYPVAVGDDGILYVELDDCG